MKRSGINIVDSRREFVDTRKMSELYTVRIKLWFMNYVSLQIYGTG